MMNYKTSKTAPRHRPEAHAIEQGRPADSRTREVQAESVPMSASTTG